MKGLELSEQFYLQYGRAMLREQFPDIWESMTAGLVGLGSECFGFDDALSADHDYGADFCIWLSAEDYARSGQAVQEAYERLRRESGGQVRARFGVGPRQESAQGEGRVGVLETGRFYYGILGTDRIPETNREWLALPEERLAAAVNGKVFEDHGGEFCMIRSALLRFYPEDVRKKKMAARLAQMAQSGQYNYARCMKRGEYLAAQLALSEFVKAAVSFVYLLNKRYCPFYKWMHRGMKELTVLSEIGDMLALITDVTDSKAAWQSADRNVRDGRLLIIEAVCQVIAQELRAQGLTSVQDSYLEAHAVQLWSSIEDEELRSMHILRDGSCEAER